MPGCRKLKVLVVGCGSIGRRHAVNAARRASVAVLDKDPQIAQSVAQSVQALPLSDWEQATQWGPDAAVVAVPTHLHLPVALALPACCRYILLEKPLSHSLDQVDTFLHLLRERRQSAFVVCNMRFHPGPRALKQSLHLLGRPYFARAWFGSYLPAMRPGMPLDKVYAASRKQGGGVILDCIHEIDYLSWLLGEVTQVTYQAARLSDLPIDVEDYACLLCRHKDGPRSQIHLDFLQQFKKRGCHLVGSEGELIWSSEGKSPEICTVRHFDNKTGMWQDIVSISQVDKEHPYINMMDAFLDLVAGGDHGVLLDADAAAKELSWSLKAIDQGLA